MSAINLVTATEYYYTPLDYYFITSRDSEKAALDGINGWTRTGRSLAAFSAPVAGTNGLTRYYFDKVAVKAARGSHFYAVLDSDRDALAAQNPGNASAAALPYFEGNDSFSYPPISSGASGACPAGTQTVYRVFRGNTRFPDNPNHRFTTDQTLYQQFVNLGWEAEGVSFCLPATLADNRGCVQKAYFPDVSSRSSYIDKNLDGKTGWDSNSTLQPTLSVNCTNGVVSVASNGVPNFDSVGIGMGGTSVAYQTNARTWRFPQQPLAAAIPAELRNVLGPIAVMINGVQIYGPVEAPMDNYADPFKASLSNYYGGHVMQ